MTCLEFLSKPIYMNWVSRSSMWADSVVFVGRNSHVLRKRNATTSSVSSVSFSGSAHPPSIIPSHAHAVAQPSCKIELFHTRIFLIHSFFSILSKYCLNMTFLRDVSQWVHKMIDPTPTEYKKHIAYRKKKSSKVLPVAAPSTPIEVVVHTYPDTPF